MVEKLALVNRYHGAWLEQSTRVAQRQNVIQIYLASVTALFGFYFANISGLESTRMPQSQAEPAGDDTANPNSDPETAEPETADGASANNSTGSDAALDQKRRNIGRFLYFATLFLAIASTALVWIHHRAMQNLCGFMARCEKHANVEIRESGGQSNDLYYFYNPESHELHEFHSFQRRRHRVLISIIFLAPVVVATCLTSTDVNWLYLFYGNCFAIAAAWWASHDLRGDNRAA